MLLHLSIRNFAVVKSLDIDLSQGMTAVTGETGAGKSISVDALGLCLGDRAEAGFVRSGADKAEICASFDVSKLSLAAKWLKEHELDDGNDCLIRRVISSEGRSKAFVNGTPVPLGQLKCLGQYLLSIHGQHAHQQILKADTQRELLDNFAEHPSLLNNVAQHYQSLQHKQKIYRELLAGQQQRADRFQLLSYQVSELDEFAIGEGEFSELESEHKRLSNSQALLEQTQLSFYQLYEADDFNALSAVQNSIDRLTELQDHDPTLSPILALLNEASIQIDEAAQELRDYTDQLEIDPMKMQQVEARYSQALDLARKHHVKAEELYTYHQTLTQELSQLSEDDQMLDSMQDELSALEKLYFKSCEQLSLSRTKAASKLAKQVESQIHKMNMGDTIFKIEVEPQVSASPSKHGLDNIQFKVSTNKGQALDKIEKVVSGGELSRIGLAIQVISSHNSQVATMIFDEVDTGISGSTASVVGHLLRKLGETCQVICVTHLPQVAARAHNQMFVTKFSDKKTTETHMISLQENERIEELARLLAGDKLTDSALANAKELLQISNS
ncbi:DNA replication and repair protein RecN [Paraglaciecola sp. T6c]|uniref:DNA repair protein RecN n=1 Tax=Pseudoalteromonas atlantica (strain T6c / ATCC BAA-1087) TaxID=3042615 RepID=UPI00005C603E|nr:DNA repair protein RecN [Paraglaciecola sp. T6c]ABG40235.1 DNA replication and repair protein RecN [Paraglaciecola sp. T6c]